MHSQDSGMSAPRCARCGYALVGLGPEDRCPECGSRSGGTPKRPPWVWALAEGATAFLIVGFSLAGVLIFVALLLVFVTRSLSPLTLALLASVLVAAAVAVSCFAWRLRTLSGGHPCETCGYDLRGRVRGKCPECGTPFRRV